ncbi:hypothetical protein PsAD2_01832 [Pseudovibrio axinellae]|uniref:Plasmid replication protein C N-terminal domain-containing protein n=1 Tax=Pseudovibrio axinellae TaxID=989403 RepID=A0A165Z6H3_9HYPH|nr:helix-turn-helix domain-containing protein [Pseudovibrio axinellae]KZL19554.1 hypothetical protein PsAD2_01832 [Pseudovibrio axinellae]SEQ31723.1 Replication protein C N-terminal domain-containing protein [Pseudovibrio axinellae]
MSLTLTHNGLPEDTARADVLTLIDKFGPAAGLSGTDIKVLKHYVLKVRDDDFQKGRICAVWQRLPVTAQELDLNERAITRAENRLIKAGWLLKTNAPKSRRYGHREKTGDQRIAWTSGINLQPLIDNKVPKLLQLAKEREEAKQELVVLQSDTKRLFGEIRLLSCSEALERALTILPFGRLSRVRGIEQLNNIKTALSSLLSFFKKRSVENPVEERHLGQTKAPSRTDKMSARSKTIQKTHIQNSRSSVVEISLQRCLDHAHPDVLENMHILGGYTLANFIETASLLRRQLRISDENWAQACQKLSRPIAATLASILYKNHQLPVEHSAHVKFGNACFDQLVRKAVAEPQFLSRLFFRNDFWGQPS